VATEKSERILIFAGTAEGHDLARFIAECGLQEKADIRVATEYGAYVLRDVAGISVAAERLDRRKMEDVICTGRYALVIDATHPYALEVTNNIREACDVCGTEYLRLLRSGNITDNERIIRADSAKQAAEILNATEKKFLLTTGTKELKDFSDVKAFSGRASVRILPAVESLKAAIAAGVQPKNIVCMQGPFTREMNAAVMKQLGAEILVTKRTGTPGGFDEKAAMADEGYIVIVIERPEKEEGYSADEIKTRISRLYGIGG
jgi:precorrin-6x reductase